MNIEYPQVDNVAKKVLGLGECLVKIFNLEKSLKPKNVLSNIIIVACALMIPYSRVVMTLFGIHKMERKIPTLFACSETLV